MCLAVSERDSMETRIPDTETQIRKRREGRTSMTIAIASDHGGYELKRNLTARLEEAGHTCRDFGTDSLESCDYPDFCVPAARAVASGECERGIVI